MSIDLPTLWSAIRPFLDSFLLAPASFVGGLLVKDRFDRRSNRAIEDFKSALKGREAKEQASREQVASIHKHLMERSAKRGSELENKKIQAIEQCWNAVLQMAPFKSLGPTTEAVNLRKLLLGASENTSNGHKIKEFASLLLSGSQSAQKFLDEGNVMRLDLVQLYLSSDLFQILGMYKAILIRPFVILKMASMGSPADLLKSSKETNEKLKAILPAYTAYIDQFDENGYPYLSNLLEEKILNILRHEIGSNPLNDLESVEAISTVMRESNYIVPNGYENTTPPPEKT